MFSASVLYRKQNHCKDWSMKFSKVDTRLNTPNINTSCRDLCEKVGQMLCTLSFNVAGKYGDVI